MSKTFYITTPIYYTNGEPHLGHVYTTICADAVARYHRRAGTETFFLTGTDEHGIKMVKTAIEKNITPQELTDQNVKVFEAVWKEFEISHDFFIRTTSELHKKAVTRIVDQLTANGDIYLGAYQGWYDEGQEEFVTETEAKVRNYLAFNKKPLVRYAEPTYYFKLSKYAGKVKEYIEAHPEFVTPESRRNEVLSKLAQGVDDLSISRVSLKWGIPLPQDPDHVLYVWIDALSNYITALGYGSDEDGNFKKYWPANVHLIGKEILWFHAVYWPAMLMSLGLEIPRQLYAHGWWTSEGEKMSKTLGNFIDLDKLRAIISKFGLDPLRYYLLRAAPFGNDLDWKDAEFANSYTELGNVLGNCLNRIMNMIPKYRQGVIPAISGELLEIDNVLLEKIRQFPAAIAKAYETVELQNAALLPIDLARATNGYIDATAPFKLAKDPAQSARLDIVLNLAAQGIYAALVGLLPILPTKAAAALAQLGVDVDGQTISSLLEKGLPAAHAVGTGAVLFPRIEEPKAS